MLSIAANSSCCQDKVNLWKEKGRGEERRRKRRKKEGKKKENDPDLNSSFQFFLRRPMFFIPYSLVYMMLRWVIIEADSR